MKSKKAISPVIATLVLIIVTLVAGIIIYFYTVGFMQTGGQRQQLTLSGGVSAPGDGKTLFANIRIENTGTIPLELQNVRVLSVTGVAITDITACEPISGGLDPCTVPTDYPIDFSFTTPPQLAPGQTLSVIFKLEGNVVFVGQVIIVAVEALNPAGNTVSQQISITITS